MGDPQTPFLDFEANFLVVVHVWGEGDPHGGARRSRGAGKTSERRGEVCAVTWTLGVKNKREKEKLVGRWVRKGRESEGTACTQTKREEQEEERPREARKARTRADGGGPTARRAGSGEEGGAVWILRGQQSIKRSILTLKRHVGQRTPHSSLTQAPVTEMVDDGTG